jgi:hypothetical protein
MSHDDFAFEPMRGIPAALPQGETLLWQGSPLWTSHLVHSYHLRKIGIYFAVLLVWRVLAGLSESQATDTIVRGCLLIGGMGVFVAVVLSAVAYYSARTTVYTVTSERFMIRHGIALPITMNVPFSLVVGADLRVYRGGTGDICLRLRDDQRVGYLVTWPHVRPGRITRPQPSFRSLRDPEAAAEVLARAVSAYGSAHAVPIAVARPELVAA